MTIFNNLPEKKLELTLANIENSDDNQENKNIKSTAINRYHDSNLPIIFWTKLNIPDKAKDFFDKYVIDLNKTYYDGSSILIIGDHGSGKSIVGASIIKKACQKNYRCLYVTMETSVNLINSQHKTEAFDELLSVDFLMIDDLNKYYISSEAQSELYGRALDNILRNRIMNKLPIILCSASPNFLDSFGGATKAPLQSLFARIPKLVLVG